MFISTYSIYEDLNSNVRGMVFAFQTDTAHKVGFRTDIIRGEDGSLALGLKKYGKIKICQKP